MIVSRRRVIEKSRTIQRSRNLSADKHATPRFKINKQYFERKEFPRKKAEDIIGGADAWKNVDKMDGLSTLIAGFSGSLL